MRPYTITVNRTENYSPAMRALHWGTLLLLLGSYTTEWMISGTSTHERVQTLALLHRSFGIIILGLTALRFAMRRRSRLPELPKDVPPMQRIAAWLNVIGLYALLFLQPVLGMVASMLHGDRITMLGGLVLPDLLPTDRTLAHAVFEWHGTVGLLLLGLISVHVAAALFHHFVRHDDVLATMLPGIQVLPRCGAPRPPATLR